MTRGITIFEDDPLYGAVLNMIQEPSKKSSKRSTAPSYSADDDEEDDDTEAPNDEFAKMKRPQLKKAIREAEIMKRVPTSYSDDDLRNLLRGGSAADEEDDEEDDEEEEDESPVGKRTGRGTTGKGAGKASTARKGKKSTGKDEEEDLTSEEDGDEEDEEEDDDVGDEYDDMTRPQLRKACKERGITVPRGASVDDLKDLLRQEVEEDDDEEDDEDEEDEEDEVVLDVGMAVKCKIKGKTEKCKVKDIDYENGTVKIACKGIVYRVDPDQLELI